MEHLLVANRLLARSEPMLFRKNFSHPFERVDIVGRLVRPDPHNPRKTKRVPAFVPRRPLDIIERDLDTTRRLHAAPRAVVFHSMFQKIIGIFLYLGIGQS